MKLIKFLHRPVSVLCVCLLLSSGAMAPAQTSTNGAKETEQLIDAYISVMTMAYPPAGATLGAAKGLMSMMGFFDNPDLVGEALRLLNQRLDNLEKRVDGIEAQLREITNEVFRTENRERLRQLRTLRRGLLSLTLALQRLPADRNTKLQLADEARLIADEFLADSDLWRWNDVRRDNNQLLPADFKPLPALDYYVTALVAWVATIEYVADGDADFVKRTYGDALQKHIAYLSNRTGWNELNDEPQTLSEQIEKRITCYMEPVSERPHDGECTFRQYCDDGLARTRTIVASGDYTVSSKTDLCYMAINSRVVMDAEGKRRVVYGNAKTVPEEEELERAYGTQVMQILAAKLTRLKNYGTVREQFIGTFSKTPANYQPLWVYAVKNDGDILWYRKDTGESPWQGPKSVGAQWNQFTNIIAAGGNSLYALTSDGRLLWYQHQGFNDGARIWKDATQISSGFRFTKIFSGGEGIVYAIKEDGDLLWYRHNGYANGSGPETVIGPKSVGAHWNQFKEVFGNGQGDVYAIKPNGDLMYYHELDYANGARAWYPERALATGWQNYRQVIPAGGGVILAIKQDGTMLWYRHYFAPTAPSRNARIKEHWEGPVVIGSGWQSYRKVIALIPAASVGVVR